jgi:hypothetical protein
VAIPRLDGKIPSPIGTKMRNCRDGTCVATCGTLGCARLGALVAGKVVQPASSGMVSVAL